MPIEYKISREEWPYGPWDQEPADRVEWQTEAGFIGLLVRTEGIGSWCGYVALPRTHPDFGKDYDNIDVKVHGGLTYSNFSGDGPIASERTKEELWWVGFDCCHNRDVAPGMLRFAPLPRYGADRLYRTQSYVQEEVEKLARQLAQRTN